jgi:uncharacterized glyoxalase superfamily protein PhnB
VLVDGDRERGRSVSEDGRDDHRVHTSAAKLRGHRVANVVHALYEREAAAQDAGVPSEGSGFRGVSLHCIVQTAEAVDETMAKAVAAGGAMVKAAGTPWGYFGYFGDPDGYLWKVASSSS